MKQLLMGTILALVGGLLFVSLASAQAPVEVKVTLSEMKVELSTANVPAGTAVTYVITNNGKLTHEVVLEKEGADDEPLEFGGKEQEAENIAPGATVKAEWTIPEAGRYQLACHIEGHYEAGMKTAFTATVGAAAWRYGIAKPETPVARTPSGSQGSVVTKPSLRYTGLRQGFLQADLTLQ